MRKVKITYIIVWAALLVASMVLVCTLPSIWIYYNGFNGISLQDLGLSNEVVQKLTAGLELVNGVLPKKLGIANVAQIALSYMTAYVPKDFPNNNLPVKFWASVIFVAFMYIQNLVIVMNTLNKTKTGSDAFFNVPIIAQSIVCLAFSVVVALFVVIHDKIYYVMAIVVYLIIIVASFIVFLGVDLLRFHIKTIDNEDKTKREFQKNLSTKLNLLATNVEHGESNEALKKLIEELKYIDSVTSDKLVDIENKIDSAVTVLSEKVIENGQVNIVDDINKILKLVNQRNILAKSIKED